MNELYIQRIQSVHTLRGTRLKTFTKSIVSYEIQVHNIMGRSMMQIPSLATRLHQLFRAPSPTMDFHQIVYTSSIVTDFVKREEASKHE